MMFTTRLFSLWHTNHQICLSSRILASSLYTKPPSPSSSSKFYILYNRIQSIRDPKASVVPVLEQWINEGNSIRKHQLQHLVRLLKDFKRFNHALEISFWMTDRRFMTILPSDVAVRLALIHRVYGVSHAEKHFENLSDKLKTINSYCALLGGYVREKYVDKAEEIMQKMREKGMATLSFPYNMLINLYSQTGDFNKIDMVMQEMERNGIRRDKYTMKNLMAAYIANSDISGMEGIFNQIKEDPHLRVDWKVYSLVVTGYIKAGLIEIALTTLKEMERVMPKRKKLAFDFILSHYANTGNKKELYRVWDTYKPSNEPMDTSYCIMIKSLSKLDDVEGAEKIFQEWESQCTVYDFRVLNGLLVGYCRKGLFEKAEQAIEKASKRAAPYAITWNIMAMGYVEQNQMSKAVEMLKRAMLVSRKGWTLDPETLKACLDYLEGQGDVERMEEIIRLLKNTELTRDIYQRLLRTYIRAGKSVTELDRVKMDDFAVDCKTLEYP